MMMARAPRGVLARPRRTVRFPNVVRVCAGERSSLRRASRHASVKGGVALRGARSGGSSVTLRGSGARWDLRRRFSSRWFEVAKRSSLCARRRPAPPSTVAPGRRPCGSVQLNQHQATEGVTLEGQTLGAALCARLRRTGPDEPFQRGPRPRSSAPGGCRRSAAGAPY